MRPDVALVFLRGIDHVSHVLWGHLEPAERYPEHLRPNPDERRAGRAALERYYEFTDRLIGALARGYGADDLRLVVSDHGFEAGVVYETNTGVHHSELARDGVVFAAGPGIAAGSVVARGTTPPSVLDVTPSILAFLGLPAGRDLEGRPFPFLDADVPPPIESHADVPIHRLEGAASGAESAIFQRLEALGYLDAPAPDPGAVEPTP